MPPQNEVVSILQQQAKIEPGFTQLVWQKLEEQNPDFFRCVVSLVIMRHLRVDAVLHAVVVVLADGC